MSYVDFESFDTLTEYVDACIVFCTQRSSQIAKDARISGKDGERFLALSPQRLSKLKSGKLGLPVGSFEAFCSQFAHISCHKLVLDDTQGTVLPLVPNAMLDAAYRLKQNNDTEFLRRIIARYGHKALPSEAPTPTALQGKRISEFAETNHRSVRTIAYLVNDFFDHSFDRRLSRSPNFYASVARAVTAPDVRLTINVVASMALAFGVTLDYLLAVDYSTTSDGVYFRNFEQAEDGTCYSTEIKIDDKDLLLLLSIYLRLPDESQVRMQADIMARSILFSMGNSDYIIPPKMCKSSQ